MTKHASPALYCTHAQYVRPHRLPPLPRRRFRQERDLPYFMVAESLVVVQRREPTDGRPTA